ncbi:MAG: hypothetical protein ACM31C_13860 [Acidobacteriota bacterium]
MLLACLIASCGNVSKQQPGPQPDAPVKPPDGPASSCSAGAACTLDGSPALCGSTGSCGDCVDTTDDAKCAAAYGPGTLCVQGACVAATCHTSADCGGQQCVDNQCVGCRGDADCDVGQICSSGSCIAAGNVCSGKPISSSCGTGDLCCNRASGETCVAAECCVAADCTAKTGANSTCQAGSCVPSGSTCVPPAAPTIGTANGGYFVDPSYMGPSTGTQACPFKTLHGAFNAVRNDSFTGDTDVIIKGGTIDATSEGGASFFPLTVPSSVYLRTAAAATSPAVIVAPANTSAFEAPYVAQAAATSNWAARISNLEIKQATLASGGTAVHVTGGTLAKPVHLDHLNIHNFFHGINVGAGGNAELAWGVTSHDNASTGLYIGGGQVDMLVGADADARSRYDSNSYGIWVTDDTTSQLTIEAAEPTTGTFAGLKTVTASSNTHTGIHLASPNANNSLSNVGVDTNGTNGVVLYGGATAKLRHMRIQNSGSSAIHISDNGSLTSLANLDLGTAADLGYNQFTGSVDSHVCVGTTPDGTNLRAKGNTFGTADCSVAGTTAMVRSFLDCVGHGGGINDPAPTVRESVDYCTLMFH